MNEKKCLTIDDLNSMHDAEITGISVNRAKSDANIQIININNVGYCINIIGFCALRVTDFIHQNVISKVYYTALTDVTDEKLDYLIKWVNSLTDNGNLISPSQVASYRDRIRLEELILIAFEPSWGSELVAICHSVEVYRN